MSGGRRLLGALGSYENNSIGRQGVQVVSGAGGVNRRKYGGLRTSYTNRRQILTKRAHDALGAGGVFVSRRLCRSRPGRFLRVSRRRRSPSKAGVAGRAWSRSVARSHGRRIFHPRWQFSQWQFSQARGQLGGQARGLPVKRCSRRRVMLGAGWERGRRGRGWAAGSATVASWRAAAGELGARPCATAGRGGLLLASGGPFHS